MAETYGIYDYRKYEISYVATLVAGLRENSRLKMKLRGADFSFDTLLSISIVDLLNLLLWSKTKDASKGRNRPKPLLSQDNKEKISSFGSIQEFELVKKQITEGG